MGEWLCSQLEQFGVGPAPAEGALFGDTVPVISPQLAAFTLQMWVGLWGAFTLHFSRGPQCTGLQG